MSITISQLQAGRDIYLALGGGKIVIDSRSDLPSLSKPRLNRFVLADARDEFGIDLFKVLRWDYSLATTLVGRADELEKIKAFATGGSMAAEGRLLCGEGGAGKTRLAADAARQLAADGWAAGFIPSDFRERPFRLPKSKGLFLILDYPEERPDETEYLLRLIADVVDAPCKLRFLFLSRRSYDYWASRVARCEGRFGRQEIGALSPLLPADCLKLIREAAANFAQLAGTNAPSIDAAIAWIDQSPLHRLPLYAGAAAIHAVLEPTRQFGLAGADLLRNLAKREKRRVDQVSLAQKLGESGLSQLLALAVLADGLDEHKAAELARLGAADGNDVVSRLAQTPWWRAGRLIRLEPDPLAAAFVEAALFPPAFPQGREALPEWLLICLKDLGEELGHRLSRILYDCAALHADRAADAQPLAQSLDRMLTDQPERARALHVLAHEPATTWTARSAARVAQILCGEAEDPALRGALLNNLSIRLCLLGRHDEALQRAEEALAIYGELAAANSAEHAGNLARVLANIANIHIDLQQHEIGLAPARQGVGILRELAALRPDDLSLDLGMALNALSRILSALGQRDEALSTSIEQVDIFQSHQASPQADDVSADLAGSLTNLSNEFAECSQPEEALAAAQAAIEILAPLAKRHPDAYTHVLGGSLGNYANRLSAVGRHDDALQTALAAVEALRPLSDARPEAHAPDLAGALLNLANKLQALNRHRAALAICKESAAIYRVLTLARPGMFILEAATAYNTLAYCELDNGRTEDAVAAARRSVEICGQMNNVTASLANEKLAMSLNTLATCLGCAGEHKEAASAVSRSVTICRALAAENPEKFEPYLALALNNLAETCATGQSSSNIGQLEEAEKAASEALRIIAPYFLERPAIFAGRIKTILTNYQRYVRSLDRKPDESLVSSVRVALGQLGLLPD
jgi:tetratricopeptide (TPR) repeat protein